MHLAALQDSLELCDQIHCRNSRLPPPWCNHVLCDRAPRICSTSGSRLSVLYDVHIPELNVQLGHSCNSSWYQSPCSHQHPPPWSDTLSVDVRVLHTRSTLVSHSDNPGLGAPDLHIGNRSCCTFHVRAEFSPSYCLLRHATLIQTRSIWQCAHIHYSCSRSDQNLPQMYSL